MATDAAKIKHEDGGVDAPSMIAVAPTFWSMTAAGLAPPCASGPSCGSADSTDAGATPMAAASTTGSTVGTEVESTPDSSSGVLNTALQSCLPCMPGSYSGVMTCMDCELPVDITDQKVRIRGKAKSDDGSGAKAIVQCPVCNSKRVMMARELGKWPTQEFEELAKEEQVLFYRQATQAKTLRMKYAHCLARHQIDRQKKRCVSVFQPLSYWGKSVTTSCG